MWAVTGNDLTMCEGDYGVALPITVNGTTLTAADEIRITIKRVRNAEPILTKTYGNIENNTVNLVLSEAESELFPVGVYIYAFDWFQNGVFMCNIIPYATFKVVDKA